MSLDKNFKCEYCPSVLGSKTSLGTHLKKNKACLKLQGKEINKKNCLQCGFMTSFDFRSHKCRPEAKEQINKIKILSDENDKLNNNIKGIKLDHKDMISNMKDDLEKKYQNTIKKLEKKFNKLELENEKHISDFVNLERTNDIIIDELKTELKEYKSKIFDIASKPSSVVHNANTTTNNNIQMLIQKLVPVSENEMIKLFETVCTKEIILKVLNLIIKI
jgi:SMC interacting uncharacterized protein involved in chromosome segregation